MNLENPIVFKIYRLLCYGHYKAQVAREVMVSKQYVQNVVKFLEKQGLIQSQPKSYPMIYKPTDRPYPVYPQKSTSERGGRQNVEIARAHALAFKFVLIGPPKKSIPWSKKWVNNSTEFFQFKRKLSKGTVTIRAIFGKNSKTQIVFFMPEKYLTKSEIRRYERVMQNYAGKIKNWFQKSYCCRLGDPEVYQKGEIAFPEDPETIHFGNKYNLRTPSAWVDHSEGSPEWETNDIEVAKAKIEMPERVIALENQIESLHKGIEALNFKIDNLTNALTQPPKPDDGRGYY